MRKGNNQMLDFLTDLYYYKKAYLIGEDCLGHAVNKITKPYEDRIETIYLIQDRKKFTR